MAELIAAWLPLVVIMLIVVVMGRYSMKSYADHAARVETVNNELAEMNRDMLTELREIKQLLKDQK